MNESFFELVQMSIGNCHCPSTWLRSGLSRTPTDEEWSVLYDMAKKQCLVGICFAGVQRLCNSDERHYAGMTELQYLTWMGMAAKIQQRNAIMNKQCVDLQARLYADGMQSCILKGQGVAALYPTSISGLRQSGDIDVWMEADRDDVIAYVKHMCPDDDVDISSKHIEFSVFDDTIVEAHFVPAGISTPIIGRRVSEYYESEKKQQMEHKITLQSGEVLVAPDNAFQAIHILHHAFGHFLFEGVGLRQLLDYYFVMQQPFSDEEKSKIVSTMKRFEMYKFAQGVEYVLQTAFGASEGFIPANESFGKRILKSVMEEGNFGKYDEKRDDRRMNSSWYRFWYHNIRMWKYFDMAPWIIATSPFVRIKEYAWRLRHGYFKKYV